MKARLHPSIKDRLRLRRFVVRHDGGVVGQGLSYPDGVQGLRWRGEKRMVLVLASPKAFAADLAAHGAELVWLDPC